MYHAKGLDRAPRNEECGELADGTIWYNSNEVGRFPFLGKRIFGFIRAVRTHMEGKWGIFDVN